MRIQDHYVEKTKAAAEEAFRYAKAVPADKLDWKPLDAGRSVLDICRELAMTPTWAIDTIEGKPADYDEAAIEEMKRTWAEWKTVEDCQAQFNQRSVGLYDLYKNMPDERLAETRFLPYDGGRDFTMVEMMGYPTWNLNYHTGQIAYIQILLGDREMH